MCCASLAECVSNADDILGEMFLEEKTPTEDDIKVCHWGQLLLMEHFIACYDLGSGRYTATSCFIQIYLK